MLQLKNFEVSYQSKKIVKGVNLKLKRGELLVLMGPNGSGKSTLANALMGHPFYELGTRSKIIIDGKDITSLSADKRFREGLFLAFQNPLSIAGISLTKLFREVDPEMMRNTEGVMSELRRLARELNFSEGLLIRGLNDGFSGGEKKKIEMLQAYRLAKKYALFDEIDTGLDVDALKKIAELINQLKKQRIGCLIITHYQRLTEFLEIDRVIVMSEGKIVAEGGRSLIRKIEKEGYKKAISLNHK